MTSRKKRILSLLLTLSMFFVSGCGKKEKSLLEGTILEKAHVFNCDGDIIVGIFADVLDNTSHAHYRDLVSNALFSVEKCNYKRVKSFDKVEELGLITSFLTEDELLKITSDKLTEEDIYNILIRITTSEITKEDSKTLSLTGK